MKSSFFYSILLFVFLPLSFANASFDSTLGLNSQALINLVHNMRSLTQACLTSTACGLEKNEADLLLELINASEAKEFILEFQPTSTCSSHDFSFLKWSICEPLLGEYDSDHNSVLSASEAFYFVAPQFERGTRGVSLVASGLAAKVSKILTQILFETFIAPADMGLYFTARNLGGDQTINQGLRAEIWADQFQALNISSSLVANPDCHIISWEVPAASRMQSREENIMRFQLIIGQRQLCKGREEAVRLEKSLTLLLNLRSREIQLETP